MHTYPFFRISCVVTSSAYASFRHFFTSTCVKLVCQIHMSGNHVFLNLRHKSREGLSGLCAKMAGNLNTFENRRKFASRSNRKILSQKVYFLIWT